MLDRVKNRDLVFSVLALWTLAVAKPLLDVLEPTPEYWVANRIEGWTIVLIVLTLSVAIPVVLSTVLLVGKRIGRRGIIGASLFGVVFVVLAAIGIYHSLSFVLGKPVALAAGSLAAAFLALWMYHRFEAVRNFFAVFGVLSLVVPVSFLVSTKPLLDGSKDAVEEVESVVELTSPLVLIVFDEMSLASLLDEEGEIDGRLFPNFKRLASNSTWFQNASTSYGNTEHSIPSLLTGRLRDPTSQALISYKQNPKNLFTLVYAPDGVFAMESVTHLCPTKVCAVQGKTLPNLARQVVADFVLIYLNVMVPDRFASSVEVIPHRFDNLASVYTEGRPSNVEVAERSEIVQELSHWFEEGRTRSLVYLHFALPHAPYNMNPDGSKYMLGAGYEMLGWDRDTHTWIAGAEFHVAQGFQRYLLQTMYADKVLGEILDCLKDHDVLEESTIIVTSDHGVGFTAGHKRRSMRLVQEMVGELNAIPLLWKERKQLSATRSLRNVELFDVLPILLAQLGAENRIGQAASDPIDFVKERLIKVYGGEEYSKNLWPEVRAARDRLFREIDIVRRYDGSYFPQPKKYGDLIGMEIAEAAAADAIIELDNPHVFSEIMQVGAVPQSMPNYVAGVLRGGDSIKTVAISINGIVADVVDVFIDREGQQRFASTFNPDFLRRGVNELAFYAVHHKTLDDVLFRQINARVEHFRMRENGIVDATGRLLRLEQKRLVGAFDTIDAEKSPGLLILGGWMGDRSQWKAPIAYLVVYGDEQFLTQPNVLRKELASQLGQGMLRAGFSDLIRIDGKFDPKKLRVFVIFDNESYAEMEIRKGMQ